MNREKWIKRNRINVWVLCLPVLHEAMASGCKIYLKSVITNMVTLGLWSYIWQMYCRQNLRLSKRFLTEIKSNNSNISNRSVRQEICAVGKKTWILLRTPLYLFFIFMKSGIVRTCVVVSWLLFELHICFKWILIYVILFQTTLQWDYSNT